MKCPFCNHLDTRVINSRTVNNGEQTRRRRRCPVCDGRFTTFEVVERAEQVVVKRDGKRESYMRDRLLLGLQKACKKRPVTEAQIESIINYVEKESFRTPTQEVTSEQIGKLVLKRLKDIDKVAYLRFASVYKQFTDLHDFNNEIKSLLKD